jgi:restriction system protein
MARDSIFEDLIVLASKMPAWVSFLLAFFSFVIVHTIAVHTVTVDTSHFPPQQQMHAITASIPQQLIKVLATFGQVILPMAFVFGGVIAVIKGRRGKKLFNQVASCDESINRLSWQDFERLLGEYFRRNGFYVIQKGGAAPDGGIDIQLRKGGETYLVQCKHWRAYKVGAQFVREFYGVMASRGVAGGYFVTSGVYTKEAVRFAQGLNIMLIDGKALRKVIALDRETSSCETVVG